MIVDLKRRRKRGERVKTRERRVYRKRK